MSFLGLFKKGKNMADNQAQDQSAAPIIDAVEPAEVKQIPVVAVDTEEAPSEVAPEESSEAAPEVDELKESEAPAEESSEVAAEVPPNSATLSAHIVAHLGLASDQVEVIDSNDVESTIKAGDQELLVGNDELS